MEEKCQESEKTTIEPAKESVTGKGIKPIGGDEKETGETGKGKTW